MYKSKVAPSVVTTRPGHLISKFCCLLCVDLCIQEISEVQALFCFITEIQRFGESTQFITTFLYFKLSRGDSRQAAILESLEGYFHALYKKMSHKTVN